MKKLLLSIGLILVFGIAQAQDYRFGKVSAEEISQKEHPTEPDADAAILYREIDTEFQYDQERGWFMVTNYFERIKIYTKDGADYANKTVRLQKGEKYRDLLKRVKGATYYLDGKNKVKSVQLGSNGIIDEDVSPFWNRTNITMPDVQVGSVIELRYSVESPFILSVDEYKLQDLIPIDKVHISFSAPEKYRFQTYIRGWLLVDIRTTKVEKTVTVMTTQNKKDVVGYGSRRVTVPEKIRMDNMVYTIDMENVPAIKEEPYAGNINNYISGVQFELSAMETESGIKAYSTTWEDVAKTIYRLPDFGGELNKSGYYKKDIDELLEGIHKPEDKVKAIHNFVQNRMTWNKYVGLATHDGVRKAYKEGVGNSAEINLMLTSMLDYAGLNASPVLLSTRRNGISLFPSINGFNFVIAAVELSDKTLLLNAINKNAEMGVLDENLINGNGRLLRKDGSSEWISLSPSVPAIKQTLLSVNFNGEGEVQGNGQQRMTGNYALNHRNVFDPLNEAEYEKKMEERLGHVSLSNTVMNNLSNLSESVTVEFDFSSDYGIEEVGGKLFVSPLLFLQTDKSLFVSEKREYPVNFGFPHRTQKMVNFSIPEGYEVESLPENARVTLGDMGSYQYYVVKNGNNIQVSIDFSIHQSVIAETNYQDLRGFFETLIQKEAEKIVLVKG